jgi:hypothetical protein
VLFEQHFVWRSPQLGHELELHVHVPLSHTRLFVQTWPHEPQLLLSLCRLTHVPLQAL